MAARRFSFFYDSDLSPSGDTFKEYEITVTATTGDVVQVSTSTDYKLTVLNPCRDNAYTSIVPPSIPALLDDYKVYSGAAGTTIYTIPQFTVEVSSV